MQKKKMKCVGFLTSRGVLPTFMTKTMPLPLQPNISCPEEDAIPCCQHDKSSVCTRRAA